MKQTILHQKHLQIKAKITDFQGWQIPLLFSDVQDEYHAIRTTAGIFDISYLGRIVIDGAGAPALLQNVLTYDMEKIAEGSAHYSLICNESGSLLDDVLVFYLSNGASGRHYLLTTNAGNTEKILLWLRKHATSDVQITDNTQTIAQFALQGPQSIHILEKLAGPHFRKLKQKMLRKATILDTTILVSHTYYIGEHGYELFVPADRAEALWDAIMATGSDLGIMPCGFATRDLARLEMGRRLYGNDIDETRTPLEAGLAAFVDFTKDFIGKEALLKRKQEGVKEKLAGFILLEKGVPKTGDSIYSENHEIGAVTSGGLSPQLHKGIGLGYIVSRYSQPGQEVEVEVRDKEIAARIVDLPFYTIR